jgi:hypothetical protein
VPDELLVDRVVGRRSDPETGEIYHLTFKPPPSEIIPRLVSTFGHYRSIRCCILRLGQSLTV